MRAGRDAAFTHLLRGLRAGGAAAILLCPVGLAADEPPEEPAEESAAELQTLTVTGTRIKRIDIEGALPVTVIDRQTIDRSGESSLADYVRSLSFNTHGSYRSQMGTGGHGSAQVSLRGLGSNRSLVLINGRRLPKTPVFTEHQDLNLIPMGSVERIEVLSDGASAIYGSDAIAGVINIITRDDYRGWEFMYGLADTDSGGGDRDYGSILFGHSGEDWRLIATWSFNNRDLTLNRDFDWYEPSIDIFANNFTTVDPATGTPFFNFSAIPGGCGGSVAFSLVADPGSLSGEVCLYDDNFEAGDETSVATSGLLVRAEYDLSETWTAWLDLTASQTDAYGQLSPQAGSSIFLGMPLPQDSPNNPTNPSSGMHDPQYGPNVPVHYWHRFDSIGVYNTDVETELRDGQLGMTGWLGGADLEFGLRFTRSETEDNSRNILDLEAAQERIIDGRYDLQNPRGNSDSVLNEIREDHFWWWDYDTDEAFGTIGWDWLAIRGMPVRLVVGGEYREESFHWDSTFPGFPVPAGTDRDVFAAYFETLLPLSDSLELSLAGRYDDYSDWGNHFSPKLSVRWRVNEQFLLRASWGEGFRAPDLALQTQPTDTFPDSTTNDPRSCEAMGLPEGCTVWFLHTHTISPDLGPEESDQYSLGFVWQPLDWLNLVVDYYDIVLTEEIKDFWPDLVLTLERLGEPMPAELGTVRDPDTGLLLALTSGWGNHGRVETNGFDLTIDLAFALGPGFWNSHMLASHVLKDNWNGFEFAGIWGAPETRATLSNRYDIADWEFSWNVHYISSQSAVPDFDRLRVPGWTSHDLQVAWNARWNGTLAIGAQNAFNEQPELDTGGGTRYDTTLYDAFGRILYARYTQRF